MERSSDPGTAPVLGEGHYTVVLADAGPRTLEVTKAAHDFRAGRFIVSYLCGADNESDCRPFAHISAAGGGRLWHHFGEESISADALAALLADPSGQAMEVRGCRRCGRRCHRRVDVGDV